MPATLNNKAAKFTPKSTPARPASAADHQAPTPLALPVDAITRARPPRHYTREELKDVKRQMRDLTSDRIFDWMLNGLIKRHLDLVDPEQIAQSARKNAFPETCIKCIGKLCPNAPGGSPPPSAWQEPPCDAIADIVQSVVAEERSKHGAFLVQDSQAVFGLVQHQLAFDSPSTSSKLKKLKRDHPKVVDIIKSFLCGKGFHFPPPKADNDDAWNALLSRLRFDWIRDNRTMIFTELSKTWKKRHSPFEQFAHFLFFRDEVPAFRSLGMITHAQKPLLVAALAGDTTAFVLLARLGFCVMPDAVWENTSILKESLDTRRYAVLRHLNTYFFRKQFERPSPMTLVALQPAPAPQTLARNTPPLIPVQLPMRVWEQRPPRHHHHNTVKRESQRSPVNDAAFEASLPMESVSPALQPTAPAGSWAKAVRSAKPIGTSPVVSPHVSPAQPPTTTTPPKAEPSKKGAAATKKASA